MRLFLSICIVLVHLNSHAIEPDKQKHFAASFIISTVLIKSGIERRRAFFYTMAIGLAKELTDQYVDDTDIVFNGLGASVPLLIFDREF